MKAIRTHGRGGADQLFFEDAPAPVVRSGDVLVRVGATGITPAELTWDETYQNADGTPRIPRFRPASPSSTARAVCFSLLAEIERSSIKSPPLWTPGS